MAPKRKIAYNSIVAAHHLIRALPDLNFYRMEIIMFSNASQLPSSTKVLFDGQAAAFSALSGVVTTSIEHIVALNTAAVKTSTEELNANVKQLFSVKDPQEFMSLVTAQAKLNAEKAQSYGRNLADIVSATKTGLSKMVEGQIAQTQEKVATLVADVTKNAPAGSEQAVAMLKTVIDQANAGYEQVSKTTKQAVETVEANVSKATEQFSQAVEKTTAQITKK